MVPVEAVHVTPALAESFVTVAANVVLAAPMRVAEAGETVTLTGGAEGLLEQPEIRANRSAAAASCAAERIPITMASFKWCSYFGPVLWMSRKTTPLYARPRAVAS